MPKKGFYGILFKEYLEILINSLVKFSDSFSFNSSLKVILCTDQKIYFIYLIKKILKYYFFIFGFFTDSLIDVYLG